MGSVGSLHGRLSAIHQRFAERRVGHFRAIDQIVGRVLGSLSVEHSLEERIVRAQLLQIQFERAGHAGNFHLRIDRSAEKTGAASANRVANRGSPGSRSPSGFLISATYVDDLNGEIAESCESVDAKELLLDARTLTFAALLLPWSTRRRTPSSIPDWRHLAAELLSSFASSPSEFLSCSPSRRPSKTLRLFSRPKICVAAWRACSGPRAEYSFRTAMRFFNNSMMLASDVIAKVGEIWST